MNPAEFDIIFRGDIVIGHQLQDVKLRLQQLFKADAAKVDALFSGRPVPLKRNLDELTANKYRDVLLKAGAQVTVSPSGGTKVNPDSPAASQLVKPSGWSLAPVGSNLLTPTERTQVDSVAVDTEAMSLRPMGGNLLDVNEVPVLPTANIVTPDFDLAEVGADLVREEEKMSLPLVEIEVSDWGLANVGEDLVSPGERAALPAITVNINDFGLAPVGSDLGQLKPQINAVTPDVSGIRLVD